MMMRAESFAPRLRRYVDRSVRFLLISIMALLVLSVVWQVVSRYIVQSPSTVTDELSRFLMIWVSLLGAAYYSGKNEHIAITLLPDRLGEAGRRRLRRFTDILILLFVTIVFVIGGGYQVWLKISFGDVAPALQISMAWVYLVAPLSGLLIIFYKLQNLLALWAYSK